MTVLPSKTHPTRSQKTHPTANFEPDDFEPDGTWYSMIAAKGGFYAVEPNHGELVAVTTSNVSQSPTCIGVVIVDRTDTEDSST
jgi:hypothetical protein